MPVVLLDLGLNGMSTFSNADLTTFGGDTVNASCFKDISFSVLPTEDIVAGVEKAINYLLVEEI
jgi:hypothetical protein